MSKRSALSINRVLPLVCGFFVLVAAVVGVFTDADNQLYDLLLKIKCRVSKTELSPQILAVDLTDNTELVMQEQLDNRSVFTATLSVLAEVDSIAAFDFMFTGRKGTEQDDVLAATAARLDSAVFAITPLSREETSFSGQPMSAEECSVLKKQLWHPIVKNEGAVPEAARFLLPYTEFAQNAPIMAHIGIQADSDGVQRRIPLLYKWEDGYIPSYALSVAAHKFNIDPDKIILDAGHSLTLPLKDDSAIHIPIDRRGFAYIPYTGDWSASGRHIPLETFAEAASDEDLFWELYDLIDGHILLFSDVSTAKKDFGISPFEPVFPLAGIHSALLNGILNDSFFTSIPVFGKLLIAIVVLVLLIFCVYRKSIRQCTVCSAVLLSCVLLGCMLSWFAFAIVPWMSGICVAVILTWLLSFVFHQAHSYKERLLMQNALSRYFPRALADRVLKEGKTDLAPAKKELTILFSDICGFTKWSSDKKPEQVHAFLSDYLGTMAEIIFEHGGTVDKFIGDGILAFFGDPFDQPDNAERAVKTAIAMQKKIRELAAKWKPIVDIDLKVRIGINTGDVIVGNLGTGVRIDYTVIGAAVNLASRMESNAPVGGILVAENAYQKVRDSFAFDEPQPVTAKGYDKPVMAYVVAERFE